MITNEDRLLKETVPHLWLGNIYDSVNILFRIASALILLDKNNMLMSLS